MSGAACGGRAVLGALPEGPFHLVGVAARALAGDGGSVGSVVASLAFEGEAGGGSLREVAAAEWMATRAEEARFRRAGGDVGALGVLALGARGGGGEGGRPAAEEDDAAEAEAAAPLATAGTAAFLAAIAAAASSAEGDGAFGFGVRAFNIFGAFGAFGGRLVLLHETPPQAPAATAAAMAADCASDAGQVASCCDTSSKLPKKSQNSHFQVGSASHCSSAAGW